MVTATHATSTTNKPDLGVGLIKAVIDPSSIPPAQHDNLGPIILIGGALVGLLVLVMVLH